MKPRSPACAAHRAGDVRLPVDCCIELPLLPQGVGQVQVSFRQIGLKPDCVATGGDCFIQLPVLIKGIAQIGKIHLSGFIAWAAWLFIHLIYLIGYRNRFSVLLNWGWQYLSWQSGARLITGSDQLSGWHSHHETKTSEQKKRAAG